MDVMRRFMQHHLNPMHIFCRLRECGFASLPARRLCLAYERLVYRFLL